MNCSHFALVHTYDYGLINPLALHSRALQLLWVYLNVLLVAGEVLFGVQTSRSLAKHSHNPNTHNATSSNP